MITLDDKSFRSYAVRHYLNGCCLGEDEFKRDLGIPTRVAQQINRILINDPKGNIRLLVNNIIIFFNVFDAQAARTLMMYISDRKVHPQIQTLLIALDRATVSDFPTLEHCPIIKAKLDKEFAL